MASCQPHQLLLGHAFSTVMRQGMADLMAEHGRQAILGFGHRQNARVHHDLAARQTKGIDLPTTDDAVGPLEMLRLQLQTSQHVFIIGCIGQPAADVTHDGDNWPSAHHIGFLQYLLKCLSTELCFLLRTKGDNLMPAEWSCLPTPGNKEAGDEKSQKDRQQSNRDIARRLIERHTRNLVMARSDTRAACPAVWYASSERFLVIVVCRGSLVYPGANIWENFSFVGPSYGSI